MRNNFASAASLFALLLLTSCGSGDGNLLSEHSPVSNTNDTGLQADNTQPDSLARSADGVPVNTGGVPSDNIRTTQIVGGTVVPDLRYPWIAAIYFREPGNGFFLPGCGGSLISERWILSAAHCFVDSATGQQRSPDSVGFLLGNTDLTTQEGVFGSVSRIVVHPEYTAAPLHSDIALLELSEPVDFEPLTISNTANPVPQNGERAIVAGWGATFQGGGISPRLRQVDLPVVAHNACLPFYSNVSQIRLTEANIVCAGGSQFQRRDACQGDSGGPLFVPRGNRFVHAGIVSAGLGCARQGVPSVYTRTATFFDWINSFVNSPRVYDGSDEGSVIAVSDTIEVLDANTRIASSVARGNTNIYRATQVNQFGLVSSRGDADLYVFSSAVFSIDSLVCSSVNATTVDQCSAGNNGTYYIAAAGFEDTDYTLTVSDGSSEIVQSELATLIPDVAVTGSVLTNISEVYRATSGNIATLTTLSGNADLNIFSSNNFNINTILCSSTAQGSAQDVCGYSDADSEVFIAVVGNTNSSYSLTISSSTTTGGFNAGDQSDQPECIDTDGDGWGWDGTDSCLIEIAEDIECIDSDGDGWGWDGTMTCLP